MSKLSLSSVVAPKGAAAPAPSSLEPRKLENNPPIEVESKEATKVGSELAISQAPDVPRNLGEQPVVKRKRPWDGQDEIVQVNFEIPKRLRTKLHLLKTWERIPSFKEFVVSVLEAAADKEIAQAEKEGY